MNEDVAINEINANEINFDKFRLTIQWQLQGDIPPSPQFNNCSLIPPPPPPLEYLHCSLLFLDLHYR